VKIEKARAAITAAIDTLKQIDGVGEQGPNLTWLKTSGTVYRSDNRRHQAQIAFRLLEQALETSRDHGLLECEMCGWRGEKAIEDKHPLRQMETIRICPDCTSVERFS
jgi:hypothetical protein